MTVSQSGNYGKFSIMDRNGMWHVFLLTLKIFSLSILYVPPICSNFVSFPVHTALGVQFGFRTFLMIYSNLRMIWLILMYLCHFSRFLKSFKFLIVSITCMIPKHRLIKIWYLSGQSSNGEYLLKLHMLPFH